MMNRFLYGICISLALFSISTLWAQSPVRSLPNSTESYWQTLSPASLDPTQRDLTPQNYQVYSLDIDEMRSYLSQAPQEFNPQGQVLSVALPNPDGGISRYQITETQVLAPALAARYPMIHTFVGKGLDDLSATIRMDVTEWGFHAQVRTDQWGTYHIDPYNRQTTREYLVYQASDPGVANQAGACGLDDELHDELATQVRGSQNTTRNGSGGNLLTYRLAVAADALYSQYHGGTLSSVASALATAINGVNGIWDVDCAIRFQIIANNDQLIFLDETTDPYSSNGNPPSMIGENQGVIDGIVGSAAYDVGHVLTDLPGGGGVAGIASLRSACATGSKARGVSGFFQPVGPSFIRIIAHELGHQYAANHIFNTNDANCFGNRRAGTAFEPGSGSTIMSYAGACAFNLQGDGDNYFNVGNYDEIFQFTRNSTGNCAAVTNTGNTPPTVTVPPSGYVIPIQTPFELTAIASDADGDALTYCWEQHDLGPAGNPNTPTGNAPAFRSFPPTSNPTRVFPRLQNVLAGNTVFGEAYIDYDRDLSFRASVRDNNPAGGGLTYAEVEMEVTSQAGPFQVIYPNLAEDLTGGTPIEVTWDPANTQFAPVNADSVDIYLSADGGLTYPYLLKQATANDGFARVFLPDTSASQVRIKIKASENIFFDVSNRNSLLTASGREDIVSYFEQDEVTVCAGNDTTLTLRTAGQGGLQGNFTARATSIPSGLTVNLAGDSLAVGEPVIFSLAADASLAPGTYNFRLLLASADGFSELSTVEVNVLAGGETQVETIGEEGGEKLAASLPGFIWHAVPGASSYNLQVATSPSFSANSLVAVQNGIEDTVVRLTQALPADDIYYWRVSAITVCGASDFSLPRGFEVGDCETYQAADLPKDIDAGGPVTVTSRINVATTGTIGDANLLNIRGNHESFSDLRMTLTKVGGPSIGLFNQLCTDRPADFDLSFDDEAPAGDIECLPEQGLAYRPGSPLSALDGLSIDGEYVLAVQDLQGGNGGELSNWGIELCATKPNAPIMVRNNPLMIRQYKQEVIDQDLLRFISPSADADGVVYTLVTRPSVGSVKLNGSNLSAGDTFTQADINSGAFEYLQNGTLAEVDSFYFTLEVDGRSWYGIDVFSIMIEENTSVDETLGGQLSVYPNPTQDRLTVELTELTEPASVTVFNQAGQQVEAARLQPQGGVGRATLSLGRYATGLYLVKVQVGTRYYTRQVRVE